MSGQNKGTWKHASHTDTVAHAMGYPSTQVLIGYRYVCLGESARKIGELIGFTAQAVLFRLKGMGVRRRGRGGKNHIKKS